MNSQNQPFVTGVNTSRELVTKVNQKLSSFLSKPVDIASLVYFRIVFGAIMLWEVIRYFQYDKIKRHFLEPKFLFTYYGFDWVHPWPGDGMYYHFIVLGVLALFIMIGLFYRISTILFFLGFTYVFLLDQTQYLNHFYFVSLVSFLMIFVPAHRAFSIDAWRQRDIRSDTAPSWALWVLRAQMGIVYFYGGLAKLNSDWLHAQPSQFWLAARADYPLIGWFFAQEWFAYLFSYAGLLFDLFIVPLLLWHRTRIFGFCWAVAFHITNAYLFSIGIFPWFSIAATALFFSPDWPRLFIAWCRGLFIKEKRTIEKHEQPISPVTTPLKLGEHITIALLVIYFAFQLLVPLRHHLYPGNVSWTEEGHNFSWHMKLRGKLASARFFADDPVSNKTWEIDVRDYLTSNQFYAMSKRPDLILNFTHYLAKELQKQGYEQIEIRAHVFASLNGRKPQYLVDPTVNLASEPCSLLPAKWIMPLTQPLPTRKQINNMVDKMTDRMKSSYKQKDQIQ